MSSKRTKVMVRVVADGIQVGNKWWHNGDVLTVTEKKAKELLETGSVEKA
jgi:hypothetical protein